MEEEGRCSARVVQMAQRARSNAILDPLATMRFVTGCVRSGAFQPLRSSCMPGGIRSILSCPYQT